MPPSGSNNNLEMPDAHIDISLNPNDPETTSNNKNCQNTATNNTDNNNNTNHQQTESKQNKENAKTINMSQYKVPKYPKKFTGYGKMNRNTTYGSLDKDSNSNKSDQYKKPRARVNKVINILVTNQIEENKDKEKIVRNTL